jgi:hypothetical protein
MTTKIAMWSGPRNISTAMMRSFSARSDCAVSDEPFYGAFLKDSGEPHPMAAETIADMDCEWESVLQAQSGPVPGDKPVWYQKHMPHHMTGPVDILDMPDHTHAFLIRAPERVVASYRNKNELRSPEMLGFAQVRAYFEREADRSGKPPPVVDSDAILANPAGQLEALCSAIGIAWDPAMLCWEKGPHPDDGIWGEHWYDKVNASTGFGAAPAAMPLLDGAYAKTAEACREGYEFMLQYAITA